MNSKLHLSKQLIGDRKQGMSLSDLSKKYKLSKSTASLWCKDIQLSKEAQEIIRKKWLENTTGSRAKGALRNKQKRTDSITKEYFEAKNKIGLITERDLMIMGIGLYWAEGSKKEDGSGFRFINSDPLMIQMMYKWLTGIIGIKKEQFTLNLAVNLSHKEREAELLNFWSNLLDFPVRDFGNTTFIKTPHSRLYNNHSEYYGMLRMKVKSSSWLRRRILGMIKVFTENMPA